MYSSILPRRERHGDLDRHRGSKRRGRYRRLYVLRRLLVVAPATGRNAPVVPVAPVSAPVRESVVIGLTAHLVRRRSNRGAREPPEGVAGALAGAVAGALTGAAVGAGIGAVGAAATDRDVKDGIIAGAAVGGAAGAASN